MIDMNKTIPKIGAAIVTITVFLFALFLIVYIPYFQCFVCFFLPIGFIMTMAGLHHECEDDRRVAANTGMVFAGIYCVFVMIVYFTQITTVTNEHLDEQAAMLIDFGRHGLIFNFDLLGYGMMALSTFFIGLSVKAKSRSDKWLKALLIIHGAFFPGCVFMPMTGMFTGMSGGDSGSGGTIALILWCVYFLPIGILSFIHFGKEKQNS